MWVYMMIYFVTGAIDPPSAVFLPIQRVLWVGDYPRSGPVTQGVFTQTQGW
jgi:hypothetical protein